jgi:DNA polymerase I-like protein with 3'-5' exonuclease and polymerase domains
MNILVLDVETKVSHKVFINRKGEEKAHIDGTPWEPKNYLVSVGSQWVDGNSEYYCVRHNEQPSDPSWKTEIQRELNETELLVGHNLKYDLEWLHECGLEYTGPTWCTQIAEYVLLRGQKSGLSLKALGNKHGLSAKKTDLTAEYWDNGVGFEAMPWSVVEEYGRGDVQTTVELYEHQMKRLAEPDNEGLLPTIKMMNAFMYPIMDMERNGLKIDFDALDTIKEDYIKEHNDLRIALTEMAQAVIGDTPVRLTSNDFMSELLFSRRVLDKPKWKEVFGIKKDSRGKDLPRTKMGKSQFNKQVRVMSEVTRQTSMKGCSDCKCAGSYYKIKKDGTPWKNATKCSVCQGEGVVYEPGNKVAGFKLTARGVKDLAVSGFATKSELLEELYKDANEPAKVFIEKFLRYNAVSTYISTFVEGIERYSGVDGVLHTSLNQTITSTGRLSSSSPNLHNQPRGNTFPVRRAFVSRFEGGSILKADYGQLEFRGAGVLSGCKVIRHDVDNGVDVHAYTRDTINAFDDEEDIDRQGAKPSTFKPLYGGMSGTPREVHYYQSFLEKYFGVKAWHEELKTEALRTHRVVLPSGREYSFPYAKRLQGGYVKGTTQIVNWPVQGYATGDIVPLGVLSVWRRMKARPDLKSVMMITVHDDDQIDVYPGEEEEITKIMVDGLLDIPAMHMEFYGREFSYPLEVEVSIGPNVLEQKEIMKETRG